MAGCQIYLKNGMEKDLNSNNINFEPSGSVLFLINPLKSRSGRVFNLNLHACVS
jgi:hypothetical protein